MPNYAGRREPRCKLKRGPGARDRADGQRRAHVDPARSPTAGPSSPPTGKRSAHFEHTIAASPTTPRAHDRPQRRLPEDLRSVNWTRK